MNWNYVAKIQTCKKPLSCILKYLLYWIYSCSINRVYGNNRVQKMLLNSKMYGKHFKINLTSYFMWLLIEKIKHFISCKEAAFFIVDQQLRGIWHLRKTALTYKLHNSTGYYIFSISMQTSTFTFIFNGNIKIGVKLPVTVKLTN